MLYVQRIMYSPFLSRKVERAITSKCTFAGACRYSYSMKFNCIWGSAAAAESRWIVLKTACKLFYLILFSYAAEVNRGTWRHRFGFLRQWTEDGEWKLSRNINSFSPILMHADFLRRSPIFRNASGPQILFYFIVARMIIRLSYIHTVECSTLHQGRQHVWLVDQ